MPFSLSTLFLFYLLISTLVGVGQEVGLGFADHKTITQNPLERQCEASRLPEAPGS